MASAWRARGVRRLFRVSADATIHAMPGDGPELRWVGKRPLTAVPDPPARLEQSFGAGRSVCDELYCGENLEVLGHLRRRFRGRVDLIYLDPPFNSQADYKRTIRLRGPGAPALKYAHTQYTDNRSGDDYLQFMYERLIVCRELLSETGALFLHCDWHQSHRLRCILDELFGADMFQNELVWHYYNKLQGNVGRFAANHDTLLFYAKSTSFAFNRIRERREQPVKQIKRVWSKAKGAIVNAKGPDGKITYLTSTHKTIDDVWRLSMLQPADRREAVGYPTQKPEALLERILMAASRPGDLVLDPFMGSGTTGAVALKLGRRFVGADLSRSAVHTTLRRLLRIREAIDEGGAALVIKNGLDRSEADQPAAPLGPAGINVYRVGEGVGEGVVGEREPARDAQAELVLDGSRLRVLRFRSPALLRALGLESDDHLDWRALVDSIFIDLNYDGEVLRPSVSDMPARDQQVRGAYELPGSAVLGTIGVCIVDLLGDAWIGVRTAQKWR